MLFLEKDLAEAVMKFKVETEFEEDFDKTVTKSERVNRLLRKFFVSQERR
ncbi:MAG TPA: hypothetical protein VMY17_01590 [Thermoplasmata archaeon]|nr:hypothetical protein [Thermoplasmata archaeon]